MAIYPLYNNHKHNSISFSKLENLKNKVNNWRTKISNDRKINHNRKIKNYFDTTSPLRYVAVASVILTLIKSPKLTSPTITGI